MHHTLIKFHPLTLVFLLLAYFTGYFQYIFYFLSIIFIHEIGHVTGGILNGWRVEKIAILPFGGMTTFSEKLNRPIKEELMIAFLGPIYQILFYYLLCLLGFKTELLTQIHYSLLLFNLLPIVPLDGSKILLLFLESFCSYYDSHLFIIGVSIFFLCIFFFVPLELLSCLLFCYLSYQVYYFYKKRKQIFFKFVLERILYVFSFQKEKVICKAKEMKRDYRHFFMTSTGKMEEKAYLKSSFKEIRTKNRYDP